MPKFNFVIPVKVTVDVEGDIDTAKALAQDFIETLKPTVEEIKYFNSMLTSKNVSVISAE